jgi:transposase
MNDFIYLALVGYGRGKAARLRKRQLANNRAVRPRCATASAPPLYAGRTTACLQRGTSLARSAHIAGVRRHDLTDAQWRRLEPLLPPERPRTGRPNHSHRTLLNGILWVLRTGAPWRDLPERYGPVGTVSSRFYRWRAAGLWDRVLAALQSQAEERNEVDWSLHFVDATVIRAHQYAAGARRAGAVGG